MPVVQSPAAARSGNAAAAAVPRSETAITSAGFTEEGTRAALLRVLAALVVVRAIMATREFALAAAFGTGDALDSFLVAYLLPSIGAHVVGGTLAAALIPSFLTLRARHQTEDADRLLGQMLTCNICALVTFAGLLALAGPRLLPLLAAGFSPEKLALTVGLFRLTLPVLILGGLSAFLATTSTALGRFGLSTLVPGVTPATALIAVLAWPGSPRISVLALATLAGAVLELLVAAAALALGGVTLVMRRPTFRAQCRGVLSQYAALAGAAVVMSGTSFVDTAMAAALGPGSVSALSFGSRLPNLIAGVNALCVGTVLLPRFSDLAAHHDWPGVRQTLRRYSRWLLVLTIAPVAGMVVFSEPLVRLAFEHGAFGADQTALVAKVQALYLLQVPCYVLAVMGVRLLTALRRGRIIAAISLFNLVANVAGNALLVKFFGLAGIALSTSLVYLCAALLILIAVHRELKSLTQEQLPS